MFLAKNSYPLCRLLDEITDQFAPVINSTQAEVDTIDDLVLILSQSEQGDMLRRIANARKRVMTLHRLMSAKAEVLRVLLKRLESLTIVRDRPDVNVLSLKDTALYLGDVQDRSLLVTFLEALVLTHSIDVITLVQMLAETSTTLSRAHSNYLASISIEITNNANSTNAAMSQLTALASVLVPLNIITGLWGMNVKVPGQDENNLFWFGGIVAALVIIVGVGLTWVRWSGLMAK